MEDFNNKLILKYKVEVESVKQLLEVQEQAVSTQSLLLEEKIDELKQAVKRLNDEIAMRRTAEAELQTAYVKLKETQKQLIQSAKMASIGVLAGGVAHEINNPLTGVLNNVQLIRMLVEAKKEFSLGDFKELLDIIEDSAARCKKITQSLLDFSHSSKGEFRMFSFNEAIEKVTMLIEQELKLQNIAIQKELTADIPFVSGDPQIIQQIVFDLINNAKWAIQQKSAKETGLIILRTEYEAEKKTICLSVSDNGIGIAKENLAKIFEPFFTTKQIGEGTGLGLSIVYNVVKDHQGTIEVESDVGRGTTFRIKLPDLSS